jgi:hypothetical protein
VVIVQQNILMFTERVTNIWILAQTAVIGIERLMMMLDIQRDFVRHPQNFPFERRLFFMDENQVYISTAA